MDPTRHSASTNSLTHSSFMRMFRSNPKNKGKRCLVHCKGGRARSGSVALCYLLSRGYNIEEAFATLKSSRRLIDRRLPRYRVVQRFAADMKECGGSFERLQLRDVASRAEMGSNTDDASVPTAQARSLGRSRTVATGEKNKSLTVSVSQ